MTKIQNSVRNIWKEGGTTFCISIPIDIVKKLNLNENSMLLVELVDELIVLKKHESHLTKAQVAKAKTVSEISVNGESDSSQKIKEEDNDDDDNSNPLDGIEF
jgi:bifunctional DNA-binding transcriptional regulator/antitoxin component of YhaV-PrlF toxin-antitoxin module